MLPGIFDGCKCYSLYKMDLNTSFLGNSHSAVIFVCLKGEASGGKRLI